MGIAENNGVRGLVGNAVMYILNGKQIMRIRPRRYPQTKATKLAAKHFGDASRLSRELRNCLVFVVEGIAQPAMRYRFAKVIQDWLRSGSQGSDVDAFGFASLRNFQFNEKVSLNEKLRVQPSVSWDVPGKLILKIPAIVPVRDIAAPPKTESVQWIFMAATASPGPRSSRNIAPFELNIPYDQKPLKASTQKLDFVLNPEHLGIVTLGIKYKIKGSSDKFLVDENWLPAGVIGCCYAP